MLVGVIGGIGAGKSTVARLLVELGAEVVDADALAHEILETPKVKESLVRWLGEEVVGEDGRVDRPKVAQRVFTSPEEVKKLEALVHPQVRSRIEERIIAHSRRNKAGNGQSLLVLDVPLLDGSPLREQCGGMLFVDSLTEDRRKRVAARGWDPGELERRENLQTSVEDKKRLSTWVIDNSGTLEETRRQLKDLFELWKE
jgi:dephospho-CoA kinase